MRRFFRFSIRDLLWLTLVVGLGLGWGMREHLALSSADEWRRTAEALKTILEQEGWEVERKGPDLHVRALDSVREHVHRWGYVTPVR